MHYATRAVLRAEWTGSAAELRELAALDELGPADASATEMQQGELVGAIQGILSVAQKFKNEVPPDLAEALEAA